MQPPTIVQDKARGAGGDLFSCEAGDAVNRQSLSEATRSHQSAPDGVQGLNQPTPDQRALSGLKRNSDQMRISLISCAYDGHMETNTPAPTITKTVMHNGVEIRRSNEMTNSNAYLNRNPFTWVVDGHASKHSFKTQKQAQQFIDDTINAEAHKAYGDWSGNYFIIRAVDGKFTEVAINRDEYKALKAGK